MLKPDLRIEELSQNGALQCNETRMECNDARLTYLGISLRDGGL